MTTRARGSGSVFPFRGAWRAVVKATDPTTGQLIQRTAKAPTKAAARERLRSLMRELDEAPQRRTDTLGSYLATWLDEKRGEVRVATSGSYALSIRLHVDPYLGRLRLGAIRPADVRAWQKQLAAGGLGARSRQMAYDVMRIAMNKAVADGLIDVNVVAREPRPSAPAREKIGLRPDQVTRLLEEAAFDDEVGPIVILGALTGARLGEILGARIDDFDLTRATWTIQRTQVRVAPSEREHPGDRFRVNETKSRRGVREVPIPELIVAMIAEKRTAATTTMFVFAHPDGRPFDPRWVTDRWHRIRDRAGVSIVFHELRHAVGSQLIRQGVDPRTAAALLGHDPAMLLRTYAHVLDEQRRSAMADLARNFGHG